jgi:hypothetical protein
MPDDADRKSHAALEQNSPTEFMKCPSASTIRARYSGMADHALDYFGDCNSLDSQLFIRQDFYNCEPISKFHLVGNRARGPRGADISVFAAREIL